MTSEEVVAGRIILIDKPLTWSSFQAVNKLKYILKRKFDLPKKFKIGHAGTLDPLATGLLIICTGKFTKKITGRNVINSTTVVSAKMFNAPSGWA
jgi:tRNA pseudouridine55 synthase